MEVLEGGGESGAEVCRSVAGEEEAGGVEGGCEGASCGGVEGDGEGRERVLSDVPVGRVPAVAVRWDVRVSGEVPGDPA